MVWPFNELLG